MNPSLKYKSDQFSEYDTGNNNTVTRSNKKDISLRQFFLKIITC